MKSEYINLKIANMRKEQDFVIYPNGTSEKYIYLQSDKRFAILDKQTNELFITSKNYNYPTSWHLQYDRVKVELVADQIEEIKRKYNAFSNGKNGMIQIVG